MTVKLGYCIHCGQANITCINTQKDGTMTHYSITKQGECGPLIIDDVEIPEPNWKALARTPPQKPLTQQFVVNGSPITIRRGSDPASCEAGRTHRSIADPMDGEQPGRRAVQSTSENARRSSAEAIHIA